MQVEMQAVCQRGSANEQDPFVAICQLIPSIVPILILGELTIGRGDWLEDSNGSVNVQLGFHLILVGRERKLTRPQNGRPNFVSARRFWRFLLRC